jgi:hypothetical protein
MRLLIFVSAILIGLSQQSVAQSIGYADQSCGFWTKERSKRTSFDKIGMQSWATGYLSGANAVSKAASNSDFLKGVDGDAVWAWLDNNCKRNPLEKFPEAVLKLLTELRERALRR